MLKGTEVMTELVEVARAAHTREEFRRDAIALLAPVLGFDGAIWSAGSVESQAPDTFVWQIARDVVESIPREHADELGRLIGAAGSRGPLVDGGMTSSERQRSRLWSTVRRRLGVKTWLGAALGGGNPPAILITLARAGTSGSFSDREARMLQELAPVLELGERLAGARESAARTRFLAPSLGGALTPREREMVALVARGLTNQGIAEVLGISKNTVRNRLASACERTGAANRAELVTLAGPMGNC